MAKASIKVETVTKKVAIEIEEESFTLTLNRDEAEVLHDIFRHIGGDPEKSRRGITNGIQEALLSVLMTSQWSSFKNDLGLDVLCFQNNN